MLIISSQSPSRLLRSCAFLLQMFFLNKEQNAVSFCDCSVIAFVCSQKEKMISDNFRILDCSAIFCVDDSTRFGFITCPLRFVDMSVFLGRHVVEETNTHDHVIIFHLSFFHAHSFVFYVLFFRFRIVVLDSHFIPDNFIHYLMDLLNSKSVHHAYHAHVDQDFEVRTGREKLYRHIGKSCSVCRTCRTYEAESVKVVPSDEMSLEVVS